MKMARQPCDERIKSPVLTSYESQNLRVEIYDNGQPMNVYLTSTMLHFAIFTAYAAMSYKQSDKNVE